MGCDASRNPTNQATPTFQSTQPEWAATEIAADLDAVFLISIHAARVGCDLTGKIFCGHCGISIHAARVGCDGEWFSGIYAGHCHFNPRSPSGLRQQAAALREADSIFQSTQPEWAATAGPEHQYPQADIISIHAARVGCDQRRQRNGLFLPYFNPRSPSGLRHHRGSYRRRCRSHFNPRSPSGLRPTQKTKRRRTTQFQSTQPEWAATMPQMIDNPKVRISIHAARVGCDRKHNLYAAKRRYFNPRSPSGLRLYGIGAKGYYPQNFNPRSPSGLRHEPGDVVMTAEISIHAARVGCDIGKEQTNDKHKYFNPRSPSGLRRVV